MKYKKQRNIYPWGSLELTTVADLIELCFRESFLPCVVVLAPPNVCTPILCVYISFLLFSKSQKLKCWNYDTVYTNTQVALFTQRITNSKYFPDVRRYICLSKSESGFRCEFYTCLLPIRHGSGYTNKSCPWIFSTGFQWETSALWNKPRQMLKVIQRFGKHSSCNLLQKCTTNTFTLKMANALCVEKFDNFRHSTPVIPKSWSFIFTIKVS